MDEQPDQSDEELLDRFQRAAFGYFLDQCNLENGLVADTSRTGSPCSIAVVGFALSCYPVGVERGWMARADAASRTLVTLRFFCDSAQGEQPDATGHKGFYYHFLDMKTARAGRFARPAADTARPAGAPASRARVGAEDKVNAATVSAADFPICCR